jgi:hypothetical protein
LYTLTKIDNKTGLLLIFNGVIHLSFRRICSIWVEYNINQKFQIFKTIQDAIHYKLLMDDLVTSIIVHIDALFILNHQSTPESNFFTLQYKNTNYDTKFFY